MKPGHLDQLVDDVLGRQQRLCVERTRPGLQGEEVMVAAGVARPRKLAVDEELAHQEEVGGVDHRLEPGGQASMSLEEAELAQRRLLFLLSLLRQRLLQRGATAIRAVGGREVEFGEQAVMQRLGQVVLELLYERLLADQR